MPDMTLCDNKKCPRRLACYRYCAVLNPDYQSYSHFEFVNGRCDAFVSNRPGDNLRGITQEDANE